MTWELATTAMGTENNMACGVVYKFVVLSTANNGVNCVQETQS